MQTISRTPKRLHIPIFLILCSLVLPSHLIIAGSKNNDDIDRNSSSPPIVVAGYLPEYRSYIDVKAASLHLTDLILFSISPNPDGSIESVCCLDESHFKMARDARTYKTAFETATHKKDPQPLRILVSVGGAGRSDSFPIVSSDPARRERFIGELKALCVREELNGVDFDWEAPSNRDEYQSYLHLIAQTYRSFHRSNLLVTVALHPNQIFPAEAYRTMDRVHVMTYDMISPHTPHHADFEKVRDVATAFVNGGCPASKLVLGIPAYARHGKNPSLVKTYSEIVDAKQTEDAKSDAITSLGDLFLMNRFDGYVFDSPQNVQEKVMLAITEQMGGVFFWEIGQDKQDDRLAGGGVLLEAADLVVNGTVAVTTKDEL